MTLGTGSEGPISTLPLVEGRGFRLEATDETCSVLISVFISVLGSMAGSCCDKVVEEGG